MGERAIIEHKAEVPAPPCKHQWLVPSPIGCNQRLNGRIQDTLAQTIRHGGASFNSSLAEDLPRPTVSKLMADVVADVGVCKSQQRPFSLKAGSVRKHSVPPAAQPRRCQTQA